MTSTSSILQTFIRYKLQNPLKVMHQMRKLRIHQSSNQLNINLKDQENFNCTNKTKLDDNQEILDIYKERLKYSQSIEQDSLETDEDPLTSSLNLNHGLTGVFDIEDLVETLHYQQAEDLFVATVPKDIKYVDYIVVVSGKSQRHMQAIAQLVRRVFKHKRYSTDIVPRLEGESSSDWMALDLGNIALHIFSKKARRIYDLDSLWAVGPKYDDEYNKEEPISNLLQNQSFSLKGLEPAS
ncbi:uncharacterized protein K12H4.2 [Euwallacea fornicatus]|uniref:uncharacterized protein K12H4.2 n=1 Tax=Euwallacea fornicatus TaxID=995702 RepID=UPI00338EB5B9